MIPSESRGVWTRRRIWVQTFLIGAYLILPWLRWNDHPLIQLDVEHRRFALFGKLLFAQEVPNLVFITLSFLLVMGLMTAWFGRVWCGWACPQTVFIERIYRWIERKVEGDAVRQRSLHRSPLSFQKAIKRLVKWFLFFLVSLTLSHSFLAYFVGSEHSFEMMMRPPSEHPQSFFWVLLLTGLVLFDFGWFREQFCLVACPYGRFQSALMDDSSLFIHYDRSRPDCIDCRKCVNVCPTGIDIRNGLQMECLACTACVDACDGVMKKIGKAPGLISYQSLSSLSGRVRRYFRPRPVVYITMLLFGLSVLTYRLSVRKPYSIEVTRAIDTPYQVVKMEGGGDLVLNHFRVHLSNSGWEERKPHVFLSPEDQSHGLELVIPPGAASGLVLGPGQGSGFEVFLKIPMKEFRARIKSPAAQLVTDWGERRFDVAIMKLIGPKDDL